MGSILLLIVLFLSTIIGYKMISNVPSLLHTPLMSSMNALSGVTVLGALTITAITTKLEIFGYLAIILAMINVCGGFFVSDRMLKMFKAKKN